MTKKPIKISLIPGIPDSTKEEALNPAANLIGQAVRGITHKVFDPLVKYNIVKDEALKDFAAQIKEKTSSIPLEYRDPENLGLTLKTIEDSSYQLNSDELRDMFSSLIAASVDSRINDNVHPSFSTILKDLSPEDAKLFKEIYLLNPIPSVTIKVSNNETFNTIDLYKNILLMDDYYLLEPEILNTLSRFGLITVLPDISLSSSINESKYDEFDESDIYLHEKSKIPYSLVGILVNHIEVQKGTVEVTPIGKQLGSILIS